MEKARKLPGTSPQMGNAQEKGNPFNESGEFKTIPVCIYCDTTQLFTEEECDHNNLCILDFPEHIVREWYGKSTGFDEWIKEYTADDTVGLYDFAKKYGYEAR